MSTPWTYASEYRLAAILRRTLEYGIAVGIAILSSYLILYGR